MTIPPDTKDWTWVLERPCAECGFDASVVDLADIPGLVRANAGAWPSVLARPDVRVRPNDHTWSALEYAAHVRDVFRLFEVRLALMLAENGPQFANWNQDETAGAERYNEQDPMRVADELTDAAASVADAFTVVPGDALERTGRRGDGAVFTVTTLGRYFVHDPVHHLHDVGGATG
ncbi:DinB family protein [Glaciibacter superstes]|uniref:DinB family protein n=1 Tax=Glaciibacter superstes TaxID=501023 RepID=UPI0003B5F360|nr:DinB family protein [Glaciibacter superstes]